MQHPMCHLLAFQSLAGKLQVHVDTREISENCKTAYVDTSTVLSLLAVDLSFCAFC